MNAKGIASDLGVVALGIVGLGVLYIFYTKWQANQAASAAANSAAQANSLLYQDFDEEQAEQLFTQLFPATTSTESTPAASGTGTTTTTTQQTAAATAPTAPAQQQQLVSPFLGIAG